MKRTLKYRRTPRNYDGREPTTHHLGSVLPAVLSQISVNFGDRPDLILASWPEIIGPNFASMTQAVAFENGVLIVKVKNSSLYSLLNQSEKPKLLSALRAKFSKVDIKTILFRIG